MGLWAVVPAWNEAENLVVVIPQIVEHAISIDRGAKVLVVDDGSTDNTREVVKKLQKKHPQIVLESMGRNQGKAAALHRGFGIAIDGGATTVAMLDADGQDDPSELPGLVRHLDEADVALVTGARTVRNDRFIKRNTSKLYNWTTSKLSGTPGRDFNSGFKVMRGQVAADVRPLMYGEMHRYLTVIAFWLGHRIEEVTVQHHPRLAGVSKYGLSRFWRGFVDLLTIRFLMSYENRPSHLFGGFGFAGLASGGVILTYLTFDRLVLGHGISGRPLLFAGILLFLAGLQLVLFGLLAELFVYFNHRSRAERAAR